MSEHGAEPASSPPFTAATIAERVRAALEAADLERMAELLSPDVHWGAPGDATPPCRNREQVMRWYSKGRAVGRRGTVTALEVHANALLVGLRLDAGEERWQVLRVGPDGINDIRGFEDRENAAAYLGL
jgi:hypothetical protein